MTVSKLIYSIAIYSREAADESIYSRSVLSAHLRRDFNVGNTTYERGVIVTSVDDFNPEISTTYALPAALADNYDSYTISFKQFENEYIKGSLTIQPNYIKSAVMQLLNQIRQDIYKTWDFIHGIPTVEFECDRHVYDVLSEMFGTVKFIMFCKNDKVDVSIQRVMWFEYIRSLPLVLKNLRNDDVEVYHYEKRSGVNMFTTVGEEDKYIDGMCFIGSNLTTTSASWDHDYSGCYEHPFIYNLHHILGYIDAKLDDHNC